MIPSYDPGAGRAESKGYKSPAKAIINLAKKNAQTRPIINFVKYKTNFNTNFILKYF